MALPFADRVVETTQTTGTGTLDLDGASTGFRGFVAGIGNGNTAAYVITDGVEWETGTGVVTDASPDTLSRVTVSASSNGGAKVNWTNDNQNERDVFCAPLADEIQIDLDVPSQAEAEAGTATDERVWTAQRVAQAITAQSPRSYLAGLTVSNGSDATNDIDIAVGTARNADNDGNLIVASAIGKRIDASWATGGTPGTPTGGLSSSLSLTNGTWYHIHLILVSGTVEVGFDTSIVAENLIADHSATEFRRIGSVRRGASTNLAFSQFGDLFQLDDPALDVNVSNLGTTAVLYTIKTPLGVKTIALVNIILDSASAANVYVSSPDVNDEAPSFTAAPLVTALMNTAGQEQAMGVVHVLTNTSSQVRARASGASTIFKLATLGWVDRRGRDD